MTNKRCVTEKVKMCICTICFCMCVIYFVFWYVKHRLKKKKKFRPTNPIFFSMLCQSNNFFLRLTDHVPNGVRNDFTYTNIQWRS